MKKLALTFFLLLFLVPLSKAQEDSTGTIVIKKKVPKKTLYDQANRRIIVIDQYGILLDHHVTSFEMSIDADGKLRTFNSDSFMLTPEMTQQINNAKDGTIIYFTKIRIKTPDGKIDNYPSTAVKVDGGFRKKSTGAN